MKLVNGHIMRETVKEEQNPIIKSKQIVNHNSRPSKNLKN